MATSDNAWHIRGLTPLLLQKRDIWRWLPALGVVVSTQLAGAQQSGVYDFGRARAVIDSLMIAEKIPSIAVAVAKGDRILWESGFGMADVERGMPATANTPYSLASISKPFTATGIMVLVQREFVRLRSPVNHYLGGVHVAAREGSADGVTIERLLTHTAGLPLHYQFFYEDGGYARPPMDSTIRRFGVAVYPSGESYQYSNLGFGILDYVIARKSGKSYADFMRQEIFMPLGLTNTSVGVTAGPNSRFAQRYDAANKPVPYYTFDHPGASEVYSSAHDLARFGLFHLGSQVPGQRRILAAQTIQDMQRDVATESPNATRGLGWGIRRPFGVRQVAHSGGMPGVSTFLALYPDEKVVVVVLLNKAVGRATSMIVNELTAAMIPQFASGLRAQRASPAQQPTPTLDADQLQRLRGEWRGFIRTYADSVPIVIKIAGRDSSRITAGSTDVALENIGLDRGVLTARAPIQLAAPDLARHAHVTQLWLRVTDGRLSGYAAAQTTTPRAYYALSSYIRLERASP
jgi:CubicO group peptidase (beta-lactamase class C family)